MGDDRRQPDLQAVCDLLVHIAPGDEGQYLGLASRELYAGGVSGAPDVVFVVVRPAVHTQDIAYDGLFAGADVDSVHVRIGRLRLPVAKQDRLVAQRAEIRTVRDEQLCRDEEVEEPFRGCLRECFEIAEKLHVGHRDDLFQDGFQPDAHQDVGGYDGYGGALLHRFIRGGRVRC